MVSFQFSFVFFSSLVSVGTLFTFHLFTNVPFL